MSIAEVIESSWWTVAKDGTLILAALIGGIWALFRFAGERTFQAALDIAIDYLTAAEAGTYLVHFDVALTNPGKTRLSAKSAREGGWAFNDGPEQLRHSCGLQIMRLQVPPGAAPIGIDWFEGPYLTPVPGVPELNLLVEYEDPKRNNAVDFWLEPGECYHLGRTVVLQPGHYLAKVAFIGSAGDDNFWSRVQYVQVPKPAKSD
jgi:hypothetical protein